MSIAADPSPSLVPFLAKVLTLELTPTAKMVTVLSSSQSPTVFFFGACSDGLPKLAV